MERDEIFDRFEQELVYLIKTVGSQKRLALAMGINHSAISNWLTRKKLPSPAHALVIEAFTNGQITRQMIRPDVYPEGLINDFKNKPSLNDFTKKPFENK